MMHVMIIQGKPKLFYSYRLKASADQGYNPPQDTNEKHLISPKPNGKESLF